MEATQGLLLDVANPCDYCSEHVTQAHATAHWSCERAAELEGVAASIKWKNYQWFNHWQTQQKTHES